MATIYKPTVTRKNPKTGKKTKTKVRFWYVRYKDASGVLRQVKGFTDKMATRAMAVDLERRAARQAVGLAGPFEERFRCPLEDYERYLFNKNKGLSDGQRMQT